MRLQPGVNVFSIGASLPHESDFSALVLLHMKPSMSGRTSIVLIAWTKVDPEVLSPDQVCGSSKVAERQNVTNSSRIVRETLARVTSPLRLENATSFAKHCSSDLSGIRRIFAVKKTRDKKIRGRKPLSRVLTTTGTGRNDLNFNSFLREESSWSRFCHDTPGNFFQVRKNIYRLSPNLAKSMDGERSSQRDERYATRISDSSGETLVHGRSFDLLLINVIPNL